jgi:hypothetical protein
MSLMQAEHAENLKEKSFKRDELTNLQCKLQEQEEKKPGVCGPARFHSKIIKVKTLHEIAMYVLGTTSCRNLRALPTKALKTALEHLKKGGLDKNNFFKENYSTLTLEDFIQHGIPETEYNPTTPQVFEGRPRRTPRECMIGRLTLYLDLSVTGIDGALHDVNETESEEEDEEEGQE